MYLDDESLKVVYDQLKIAFSGRRDILNIVDMILSPVITRNEMISSDNLIEIFSQRFNTDREVPIAAATKGVRLRESREQIGIYQEMLTIWKKGRPMSAPSRVLDYGGRDDALVQVLTSNLPESSAVLVNPALEPCERGSIQVCSRLVDLESVEPFDFIHVSHTLHKVGDVKRVLKELRDNLSVDGVMIVRDYDVSARNSVLMSVVHQIIDISQDGKAGGPYGLTAQVTLTKLAHSVGLDSLVFKMDGDLGHMREYIAIMSSNTLKQRSMTWSVAGSSGQVATPHSRARVGHPRQKDRPRGAKKNQKHSKNKGKAKDVKQALKALRKVLSDL